MCCRQTGTGKRSDWEVADSLPAANFSASPIIASAVSPFVLQPAVALLQRDTGCTSRAYPNFGFAPAEPWAHSCLGVRVRKPCRSGDRWADQPLEGTVS